MNTKIALRTGLFATVLMTKVLMAAPVAYTFSGILSASSNNILSPLEITDAHFEVKIYADTDDAGYLGQLAGAGGLYAVNSGHALWAIDGYGQVSSDIAQVYTLPGIFQIGFGWNGIYYPLTSTPQPSLGLAFSSGNINVNSVYAKLDQVVDPISLNLLTSLTYPDDVIAIGGPVSLYIDGVGGVSINDISNIEYAVTAVPVPAAVWLFSTGLLYLVGVARQKNTS